MGILLLALKDTTLTIRMNKLIFMTFCVLVPTAIVAQAGPTPGKFAPRPGTGPVIKNPQRLGVVCDQQDVTSGDCERLDGPIYACASKYNFGGKDNVIACVAGILPENDVCRRCISWAMNIFLPHAI